MAGVVGDGVGAALPLTPGGGGGAAAEGVAGGERVRLALVVRVCVLVNDGAAGGFNDTDRVGVTSCEPVWLVVGDVLAERPGAGVGVGGGVTPGVCAGVNDAVAFTDSDAVTVTVAVAGGDGDSVAVVDADTPAVVLAVTLAVSDGVDDADNVPDAVIDAVSEIEHVGVELPLGDGDAPFVSDAVAVELALADGDAPVDSDDEAVAEEVAVDDTLTEVEFCARAQNMQERATKAARQDDAAIAARAALAGCGDVQASGRNGRAAASPRRKKVCETRRKKEKVKVNCTHTTYLCTFVRVKASTLSNSCFLMV